MHREGKPLALSSENELSSYDRRNKANEIGKKERKPKEVYKTMREFHLQ